MRPTAVNNVKTKAMAPILHEGQNLGKYRILESLGRGGMAQVYKAYHPQLDRYVAVKVLRSDLVEEEEFLSRFRREARAVAALRHPHIVQIYDFDVQEDLYYMVMELLEGDTLKAHLNALRVRGERLPLGELVRIFSDVLDGLAFAHGEGIIHRDLKPANIMLTRRGQAVLTDFGIAQIVGGTQYTVAGALMGTLSYMAPEQGLEGFCDIRSDIYSVGTIYYEALTGTVPFDADTPLAVLMRHINDPLPVPRKIVPNIPESLERIALKALAKQPDDRFQSANGMAEALSGAALEAAVQIPESITLRLEEDALLGNAPGVAIFSGNARRNISDDGFAAGDTEVNIGQLPGRVQAGHNSLWSRTRSLFKPPENLEEVLPQKPGRALFFSLGALVSANIIMIWASGVFGWEVLSRTWPMELVASGVVLAALMVSLANFWLLIPAGIVMGNGFIFTYFSLTRLWDHWTFLWPLEPFLVGASIVAPFFLKNIGVRGLWFTRRIGRVLLVLAAITFILTLITGIILST